MENLKSVLAAWIQGGIDKVKSLKPYAIVGGICLIAGVAIGVWL